MFLSLPTIKKSEGGFSIVEMLIAVGVMSIVLITIITVLTHFTSANTKTFQQTAYRTDLAVAERQIYEDLAYSFPSFGNLKTLDTSASRLEFFEYFGAFAAVQIPQNLRRRQIDLDAAKDGTFEFITEYRRGGERRYFDPGSAYIVNNALGTLSFDSANRAQFFTNNYREHFENRGHFFFYAPASVQQIQPGSVPNILPARTYSYLTLSDRSNLRADSLNGMFKTSHPLMANRELASLDTFFRLIPAVGGAMAQVLVSPVRVVRYRLTPMDPKTRTSRLFRSYRVGDSWSVESLLGEGIESVFFSRSDVTSRNIDFKIKIRGDR